MVQFPLAPAMRAVDWRTSGVWRACWGGDAGPEPVFLCSETSKCAPESWTTVKTPSGPDRQSPSETLNLRMREQENGLTLKPKHGVEQGSCDIKEVHLLLWGTQLHQSAGPECMTWHNQSKVEQNTSASCHGHQSRNKPWQPQHTTSYSLTTMTLKENVSIVCCTWYKMRQVMLRLLQCYYSTASSLSRNNIKGYLG